MIHTSSYSSPTWKPYTVASPSPSPTPGPSRYSQDSSSPAWKPYTVTSLTPSPSRYSQDSSYWSPTWKPYTVTSPSPSPSRYSQDSDGSLQLSIVTPPYTSSSDSPLHSSISDSLGSYSGMFMPWKQQQQHQHLNVDKPYWVELSPIREEEEEEIYYGVDARGDERFGTCLVFVLVMILCMAVFCLIIWGASRPYTPQFYVKSLKVNKLNLGRGSDYTGVPTKFMTVNSSVEMMIYNPATFFGIHVGPTPVNLFYSEVRVATGQLKHYQPRKSQEIVYVELEGNRVPLYGAGTSLAISNSTLRVPLRLEFDIPSRADVMGKLVTTNYQIHISCSLVVNSTITKSIHFNLNSCRYE